MKRLTHTIGKGLLLSFSVNYCVASNFNIPPGFDSLVTDDIRNDVANILPPESMIPEITTPDTFTVSLISTKTSYRSGEKLEFTVRSDSDCYLTLINVAQSGNVTILLPSRDRPENLIKAGQTYRLPGDELLPIAALKVTKSNSPVNQYERIEAICRSTNTPIFDSGYNFSQYPYRTFSKSVNWRSQTTNVEKHLEAVDTLKIIIN